MPKRLRVVGVLYLTEILWSIVASARADLFESLRSPWSTQWGITQGALLISLPILFFAVVALWGASRAAKRPGTQTLLPWYLLVAGFPGFVSHFVAYVFYPIWRALRPLLHSSFPLVLVLLWEIIGVVTLLVLSIKRKERVITIAFSLMLYVLGVIVSLGLLLVIMMADFGV